ncbi:hypothetical protein FQN57_003605 [Myotisia sp. PD_48]|nr:hypothetical protein FQN57_003605 [Myotisia sp. PD_48]
MPEKGTGKLRKNPNLRITPFTSQDPFLDVSTAAAESSSSSYYVPRPLIAAPQPPYSPNPRQDDSRPSTPITPSLLGSTERLTVPRIRGGYSGDESKDGKRRDFSNLSSRRTSWSSEQGSRGLSPYGNPFEDSRLISRTGSEDDEITTQTVVEKFAINPDGNLLIYPHDIENDDYLHNPDPNEKDRRCDIWNRRGIVNLGGLILLVLGVITLFVASPVVTFIGKLISPPVQGCEGDPMCLDVGDVPLLKNIRTALIDPDTPESAKQIKAQNGKTWELVFSDEFNQDGRTFFEGDDPYLQAVDIWYGVTQDLEWYDPDAVTTKNGVLELRFDAFQNHGLNYRSGMIQSWNQLCFTGGRLEASISLPGRGDVSGLWPGFWSMGNLGRPGYAATTDGMWPYSYEDKCDAGITANQSDPSGVSFLPGMKLPACTCDGEDHPTQGKSRSAPEIDVIEASVHALHGEKAPVVVVGDVSQSCQVAPFDVWYMPNYEFMELYDPRITIMNAYRGGVYQQAISGVTNLNNNWYNGKNYQKYAFEYTPGAKGEITWFVGKDKTWKLDARALGPNGNIGQRIIPVEPMTIIANLGMSNSFAPLNMTGLAPLFPATMRIDYIRIYQDPDERSVTCDPPGMETTEYIREHNDVYMNPNLTTW